MSPLITALLGALTGVGIAFIVRSLVPPTPSLEDLGRRLGGHGRSIAESANGPVTPRSSMPAIAALAERLGAADNRELARKLRLVGKTPEQYAGERLLMAIVGFSLPLFAWLILTMSGSRPPTFLFGLAALGFGVGGFLYPAAPLAEQAQARQREFRFGLGAYLDFVTIMLAGGAGTRSALQAAAEAGDGWVFAELRGAIARANATGLTIWECLEQLADELGLVELEELAASVALAGGQGGRVKDSLMAKADAMRAAQSAELETMAEASTEKMILPVVVMIAGLVLFIGVGAASVVMGGAATGEPSTPSGPSVVVDN